MGALDVPRTGETELTDEELIEEAEGPLGLRMKSWVVLRALVSGHAAGGQDRPQGTLPVTDVPGPTRYRRARSYSRLGGAKRDLELALFIPSEGRGRSRPNPGRSACSPTETSEAASAAPVAYRPPLT